MHHQWAGVVVGAILAFVGLTLFWVLPRRVEKPALLRTLGAGAFVVGGYVFVNSHP